MARKKVEPELEIISEVPKVEIGEEEFDSLLDQIGIDFNPAPEVVYESTTAVLSDGSMTKSSWYRDVNVFRDMEGLNE